MQSVVCEPGVAGYAAGLMRTVHARQPGLLRALVGVVCAGAVLAGYEASADRARAKSWVEEGARVQAGGKPDDALVLYERAIAEDPDYVLAYEAAAPLWLERGQDEVVIAHFERLTLRHPDYSFGWYTLAYAYRRTDRLAHAIMAYETCIELGPGHAEAYFGLAMVHRRAGHAAEALVALRRYVELETRPSQAAYVEEARREIAALEGMLAAGPGGARTAEPGSAPGVATRPEVRTGALPGDEAAPGRSPGRVPAAETDALAGVRRLMASHRLASALARLDRIEATTPGLVLAILLMRAEILLARGDHQAAERALWAALAAAPLSPAVHALWRELAAARGARP